MTIKKSFETIAVNGVSGGDRRTGAISFPIYQSATFRHNGLNNSTGYDYSRAQNPTREETEKTLASLEGGNEAIGFSTGVAAITACINLFKAGDHVILSDDLYGGTYRLFSETYKEFGLEATFVDTTDTTSIVEAINENTKAMFIETPSNPMMKVTDIKAVAQIAKEHDLLLVVDNTFLTPYYQRPLELGADIVIHSGTKFLGGHHDLLAGFIVANDNNIIERLRRIHMSTGATLSPFDSWLVLRGIKTLHIRLDRAQENTLKVAKFLDNNPKIEKVYYVGLENFDGYELNKKQATGFGATLSFRVKDKSLIEKILNNVKVIRFAESLGGVETLITYPITQTHSEIPEEIKKRLGVDEYLLRLSVGIENVDDLINDLDNAIGK
ncbi:trans-sulfuration enzyme family protein [Clostridium saccharobutylicum]|uniref:MccB: cystathionine gamma-lyase n=1 Tax=Clostridium saccharobutylicum DSM 13864 TaxID=1345695 RepID=U5ML51_CLOSA|nr:PLP-dependent aspartate aminotransferase family protein [Clostridium saccharobutylicum]AGX41335.1 mccB: cystathionine gamma-lyase [Clostridium saccharobutylicum DSM 13864]AQR88621.1 cystathionine gamma-lyase [Clostridium saccharobutylicum]AQR98519.1 cystathionine gamma-lyase [Clostridium saccharobutylicum]AQS12509.1 cystathionine gamma-lyase [Clostridium saccharobutylicum]MBA2905795.1 cystathionine gamma-synthase [Clostridium saccharobutylicum]